MEGLITSLSSSGCGWGAGNSCVPSAAELRSHGRGGGGVHVCTVPTGGRPFEHPCRARSAGPACGHAATAARTLLKTPWPGRSTGSLTCFRNVGERRMIGERE